MLAPSSPSSANSPSPHAKSPRRSSASYRSLAPSSAALPTSPNDGVIGRTPQSLRKIASPSFLPARSPSALSASAPTPAHRGPPVPETVDAGTQYTPPDWPPTSSRSSLRSAPAASITIDQSQTSITSHPGAQQRLQEPHRPDQKLAPHDASTDGDDYSVAPKANAPSEPDLRVTPTEALQNAIRRPLSTESSTDTSATSNASLDSKKRARHGDPTTSNLKVLPPDYSQCPPKILASIIATMLMRLIAHNDSIPLKDGQLTRFHSRAPPGISVHDYLARLTFHGTLSPPILLSMVFFIDRLSSNYPKFIINSLTVHRFLITAATAASKGLSDSFWTNHVYARVGGVTVKELALLELELLIQCDWKIVPKQEDLVEYYRGLVRQSEEYVLEGGAEDAATGVDTGTSTNASGGTPVKSAMAAAAKQTLELAKRNHSDSQHEDADSMDTRDENG